MPTRHALSILPKRALRQYTHTHTHQQLAFRSAFRLFGRNPAVPVTTKSKDKKPALKKNSVIPVQSSYDRTATHHFPSPPFPFPFL